jgi:hypothetical protein
VTSPLTALAGIELSDAAKLCWTELARFAGARGYCWPGQERLCGLLGWSRRKLCYALGELKRAGVVDVERRGQGRTAVYRLGKAVEKEMDSAQMTLDFAGQDVQTACASIYEVSSELLSTAEESAPVAAGAEPPEVSASQPEFLEFIRAETRFEIGGRMADDGTVRRLAALLGDRRGYAAFRARLRDWSRRGTPRSWGILVRIAEDVRGSGPRKPAGREERRWNERERAGGWAELGADIGALAASKALRRFG